MHGIGGFDTMTLNLSQSGFLGDYECCSEYRKKKTEQAEDKLFEELYSLTKEKLLENRTLVENIANELISKMILFKNDLTTIYDNIRKDA